MADDVRDPVAGIGEALLLRPDLAGPLADLIEALRSGPVEPELLDACESLIRHRLGLAARGRVPPDMPTTVVATPDWPR